MPKLILAVLCEKVLTDKETNLVSYINLLEGIAAQGFPVALIPSVTLASIWQRTSDSTEDLQIKVALVPPAGKTTQVYKSDVVPMTTPKYRLNLEIAGVQLKEPGNYAFRLYFRKGNRWRKAAEVPLEASSAAQAGPENPGQGAVASKKREGSSRRPSSKGRKR